MLRLDQFHELGILRVVDMCAEGYVVDRDLSRDGVALYTSDLFWLDEDILRQKREKA